MCRARWSRARETMEIAAHDARPCRRTTIASTQRLAEIAFGDWEGLTYRDVLERDEDRRDARERRQMGLPPPGGESYAQVAARVGHGTRRSSRDTVVAAMAAPRAP